ncbi:MAG: hypothetical protein AVO38_07175 [delta proteobacterium ML8_D]|nr:MAG: hypothetical protein AVO38_07175 [delta proteobacterium ML8_D]
MALPFGFDSFEYQNPYQVKCPFCTFQDLHRIFYRTVASAIRRPSSISQEVGNEQADSAGLDMSGYAGPCGRGGIYGQEEGNLPCLT